MATIRCLTVMVVASSVFNTTFAAEEPLKEQPLRLTVEIADGSRIIGVPSLPAVAVRTPFGKLDIPMKEIQHFRFQKDHKTVSVELRNGDRFTGIVEWREITLVTTFLGKVSIKIEHLRSFKVLQSRLLATQLFTLTQGKYGDKENVAEIIKKEVGDNYKLADWQDLLAHKAEIIEFIKEVGMLEGAEYSVKVSNKGECFLGGTRRHYFISRLNHNKPGYYLAHDHIDNNLIALGSWHDQKYPFLCIRKEPVQRAAPSTKPSKSQTLSRQVRKVLGDTLVERLGRALNEHRLRIKSVLQKLRIAAAAGDTLAGL